MEWKIVEKGAGRGFSLKPMTIRVLKTIISFGSDIALDFKEAGGRVEIYIDKNENKVGFKPSKDLIKGFSITLDSKKYSRLSLSEHLKIFTIGEYESEFVDDMYVIKVSEIAERKNEK